MKKKVLCAFSVILCLLMIGLADSVFAAAVSVEMRLPQENYGVQNITESCMFFDFYSTENEPKVYTIEYSVDNMETVYKEECLVSPKRNVSKRIMLDKMPKGVHKMCAKILDGDEVVKEFEKEITLIEFYKKQPLDKYSTLGMHAAFSGVGGLYNDYQIKLMDLSGIRKIRPGWILDWNKMERTPFYYSFDYYKKILSQFNESDIDILGMVGGLNAKHNLVPRTREDYGYLDKFVKFYMDTANCDVYELWNEPDLDTFFRGGDDFAIHYSTVAKKEAITVKKNDSDAIITVASVSGGGADYLGKIAERDVLPYVNALSIHPYSDNTIDAVYENKLRSYELEIEDAGHWLHKHVTELGYPTMPAATTGRATTIENQPDLVLKFYVLSDRFGSKLNMYYQFMDTGYDASNSEQMYGVVKYATTSERKPSFAILPQATKMLNSAQYVGRIKLTENADGHIYWYYGKPLMVAWSKDGDVEYDFVEKIYAEDRYGNKIQTDSKLLLGTHPVYIQGLSNKWFETAVKTELSEKYEAWIGTWKEKIDVSEISALKTEVENNGIRSANMAVELMERNYKAGNNIIDKYSDTLDIKEIALCLYQLQEAGEKYAYLYAGFDGAKRFDSKGEYKRWEKELDRKKSGDELSTYEFSDKMLNFVKWHSEKAAYIEAAEGFEGQTAIAQANHLIALNISKWIEKVSKFEELNDNLGVIAYTYPEVIETGCETTVDVAYVVENHTKRDIDAVFNVFSDNESPMCDGISIKLKSGETTEITIPVKTFGVTAGMHIYNARITEDKKEIFSQILPVNCTPLVEAKILPVEHVISELSELKVRLTNVREEEFRGTLKLTPPEGWKLAEESTEIELTGNETKEVSVLISEKKAVPFNEYLFGLEIFKEDETRIVDTKEILQFTVIVEADERMLVSDFGGDLTNWANAYPIYLNFKTTHEENVGMPDNPLDKEAWQKSNVAARCFLKWDKNNLYLLADVYDNELHQIYNDSSLWLGDSIQLSLDTMNDGKYLYQADDYEYAAGYTLSKGEQVFRHKGGTESNAVGLCPSEWLKVVRNEEANITRYLFVLPSDAVEPLSLKKGTKFGMNIGINDSDILQRDRFVQLTTGTCDTKYPEMYYDFVLGPAYSDRNHFTNIENSSFKIILNEE